MRIVEYAITTNGMVELYYLAHDGSTKSVLIPFNSEFVKDLQKLIDGDLPF
jgi:hypothetical protein